MSILNEAHFHNEEAAYARLESIVWPNGPVCPHCGNADPKRVYKIEGKTARLGLRTCAECRQQFTVKIGTVFESSHVALHKWFQAAHLMASSKKGISAHQLHRTLKVTYKTAWFMAHRLREAMRDGDLAPMGGNGKIVEADETYFGNVEKHMYEPIGTGGLGCLKPDFINRRDITARRRSDQGELGVDDDKPIVRVHDRPNGVMCGLGAQSRVKVEK